VPRQPLLDHVCNVFARDAYLLEPIADPADRVGDASEPRVVEDRLLHA
jgi:hypothetical protein